MNHATVDMRTPAKSLQPPCSAVEYEFRIAHRPVWRVRCAGARSWLRSHLEVQGLRLKLRDY